MATWNKQILSCARRVKESIKHTSVEKEAYNLETAIKNIFS